jgi:hypothetical protein
MVRPKRKEDRTLVVRLGPGDLAHNVLTHSRETNGQRSTAELELKWGIVGEPFNSVSADEITKSDIQEWLRPESPTGPPRPKIGITQRFHWSSACLSKVSVWATHVFDEKRAWRSD